jgi:tetratricopeptide (TPR) repeat protein
MIARVAIAVVLLVASAAPPAWSDDVVVFRGGREGKQTVRRTGTIRDYSGAGLVIVSAAGREETIPLDRLIEFRTVATDEETLGDSLVAEGKIDQAIDAYRRAKQIESRPWVQRRISARLVGCYEQRGDIALAGDEMLALLRADEESPHFAALPLAWRSSAGDGAHAARAKAWITVNEPAARLLGASWLLAGADRQQAINVLTSLSTDLDPRIAQLAAAQLWRTKLATATAADLQRWTTQLERMPGELRAGPLLVLGDVYLRLQQPDDALLAWLEAALVEPQRATLAAEGLLSAAAAMEKQNRTDDAARLYRELASSHPFLAKKHKVDEHLERLEAK